jgi:hypothetical protein
MDFSAAVQGFEWGTGVLVFLVYVVVDALYAYYTLQVAGRRPYAAASAGAVMYFLLAIGVLSYVHNYLYLIPLALGSWVGTFLVVKYTN